MAENSSNFHSESLSLLLNDIAVVFHVYLSSSSSSKKKQPMSGNPTCI